MLFFRSAILITTALPLLVICTVAGEVQEQTSELASNSDFGVEDEGFLVPSARTKRHWGFWPKKRQCKRITEQRNKLRKTINGLNGKLQQCSRYSAACAAKLKNRHRLLKTCRTNLKTRKHAWKNTKTRLKNVINSLKKRNHVLRHQVQIHKRNSHKYRIMLKNTKRHLEYRRRIIAKKNVQIMRIQARILKLKTRARNLQVMLDACRGNPEIDRLREQLEASEKEAEMYSRLRLECNDDIVSVKELLMETQGNLSNCQEQNEEKRKEMNALNVSLTELRTSYSDLVQDYNFTHNKLKAKRRELAEAQERTQLCENHQIATISNLTSVIAALNQWQQRVQALTEELRQANGTAEEQLHTIANVTSELDECKRRQCLTTTPTIPISTSPPVSSTRTAMTKTTTNPTTASQPPPTTTTETGDMCRFVVFRGQPVLFFNGSCYSHTARKYSDLKGVDDYCDKYNDLVGAAHVNSENRHCLQQLLIKINLTISIDRFGDDWGKEHIGIFEIAQDTCKFINGTTTAGPTTVTTTTTTKPTTTASQPPPTTTTETADMCWLEDTYRDRPMLLFDGRCYCLTLAVFDNFNHVDQYCDRFADHDRATAVNSENRHCLQQLLIKSNLTISIDRFGDDWGEEHVGIFKLTHNICKLVIGTIAAGSTTVTTTTSIVDIGK